MKKLFIACMLTAVVFGACSNQATNENAVSDVQNAPDIADEEIQSAYENYVKLKNILVKSDASAAQPAAKDLAASLSKIEGCENTAELAGQIASAEDLAIQREAFTALSSDLIALMKHAEISTGTVYVQHCPMANDNEGGYWLSSEEEIRNPYFGDEMLECGSVTEKIAAK